MKANNILSNLNTALNKDIPSIAKYLLSSSVEYDKIVMLSNYLLYLSNPYSVKQMFWDEEFIQKFLNYFNLTSEDFDNMLRNDINILWNVNLPNRIGNVGSVKCYVVPIEPILLINQNTLSLSLPDGSKFLPLEEMEVPILEDNLGSFVIFPVISYNSFVNYTNRNIKLKVGYTYPSNLIISVSSIERIRGGKNSFPVKDFIEKLNKLQVNISSFPFLFSFVALLSESVEDVALKKEGDFTYHVWVKGPYGLRGVKSVKENVSPITAYIPKNSTSISFIHASPEIDISYGSVYKNNPIPDGAIPIQNYFIYYLQKRIDSILNNFGLSGFIVIHESKPRKIYFNIEVLFTKKTNIEEEISNLERSIVNFIDSLPIGGTFYESNLIQLIYETSQYIDSVNITTKIPGLTFTGSNITLKYYEYFDFGGITWKLL